MENFLAETELALKNDRLEEAEASINRAASLLTENKDNLPLMLRYKVKYIYFFLLII